MNQNDQPAEFQSPIGVASFACFVCLAVIYRLAHPVVVRLGIWWEELLVYALIPVAVTFVILYRSHWHREIARAARASWLVLLSCVIFCGDLLLIGLLIAMLFVFSRLASGHF
jgi:uncharacterized membrane protein YgdD (TMEM256/DUF423 family)